MDKIALKSSLKEKICTRRLLKTEIYALKHTIRGCRKQLKQPNGAAEVARLQRRLDKSKNKSHGLRSRIPNSSLLREHHLALAFLNNTPYKACESKLKAGEDKPNVKSLSKLIGTCLDKDYRTLLEGAISLWLNSAAINSKENVVGEASRLVQESINKSRRIIQSLEDSLNKYSDVVLIHKCNSMSAGIVGYRLDRETKYKDETKNLENLENQLIAINSPDVKWFGL